MYLYHTMNDINDKETLRQEILKSDTMNAFMPNLYNKQLN